MHCEKLCARCLFIRSTTAVAVVVLVAAGMCSLLNETTVDTNVQPKFQKYFYSVASVRCLGGFIDPKYMFSSIPFSMNGAEVSNRVQTNNAA